MEVNKSSVCWYSGGDTGGDGTCYHIWNVELFEYALPSSYITFNNNDTPLHFVEFERIC